MGDVIVWGCEWGRVCGYLWREFRRNFEGRVESCLKGQRAHVCDGSGNPARHRERERR